MTIGPEMEQSIILVLTGGLVSLISTLAGMFLQHILEVRKLRLQAKAHPTTVVYTKQVEFFEKLNPILSEINGFITTLDVWLGESSPEARSRVEKARLNTASIGKLDKLTEDYFVFLPAEVLEHVRGLSFNCMMLSNSPSLDRAEGCIDELFAFQNKLRDFVGTDQLSEDLLKAFSSGRRKKQLHSKRSD